MRLGQRETLAIEAISTGSISVDSAIGIGGFPRGRVVEVYGPESCGKTTLALSVVAQAQKRGGIAAFIDAEHALDAEYAQASWASTSRTSWSPSRTTASRRWRSPRCWCAATPWTSW